MNARLLSIAAAVVLSVASVGAFAQSSQDAGQAQQQASQQASSSKHHHFFRFIESHETNTQSDIYHGH